MDFSSLNPNTSNPLNIAARRNEIQNVHRLLNKVNPNCVDNRGWTCLHEAAANDSFESLVLILKHPECRPLAQTHEGHTALYLACHHRTSLQTIKALLDSVEDIANYGSTEMVTPLHVTCSQGRESVIQLLIDYGAIINVQNFNGDTPLHDAALRRKLASVRMLLLAGADLAIKNYAGDTPFHLACLTGVLDVIKEMLPVIDNINEVTAEGDTPLVIATIGDHVDVVKFLLENGADPNIKNNIGFSTLERALINMSCFEEVFKIFTEHNCNVDYCSMVAGGAYDESVLPDAFIASVSLDPASTLLMLPYSLYCEPDNLLCLTKEWGWLSRIPVKVQKQLLSTIDSTLGNTKAEVLSLCVLPLKHLTRKKVRTVLRNTGINNTENFLQALEKLPIPTLLKSYLRYL